MIGREIVNRIDKCLLTDNRSRKTLKIDLGISPSTISSWGLRDSSPPAESLLRIARYLNVSLEWLITGEDEEGLSPEIRALVEKHQVILIVLLLNEEDLETAGNIYSANKYYYSGSSL